MTLRLLLAIALALAAAAPASAQTVLLSDDAEGAIDALWVVGTPGNERIQPWQKSDSTTLKTRGNMAHEGATSYWSGSSPQDFQPTEVVEGDSTLTTKAPIIIPADGKTTLSLWSFFQNEGDDKGLVEVAIDTGGTLAWKRLTEYKLTPAAVGDVGIVGYCNPADPQGTLSQEWEELTGDFTPYAGRSVWVRLNMKYGSENRAATQPCGWYVDDIKITTTGTPGLLGAPAPAPVAGPAPTVSAPPPTVRVNSLRARGKRATLRFRLSGGDLVRTTVTVLKGKRRIASRRAATLKAGRRSLTFKLRRKLRRGTYVIRIAGTTSDGSTFASTARVRAR